MFYWKILEKFLLTTIFSGGELNFNSKHFSPVKVIVQFILIGNLFLSLYFITTMNKVYVETKAKCPQIYDKKETVKQGK